MDSGDEDIGNIQLIAPPGKKTIPPLGIINHSSIHFIRYVLLIVYQNLRPEIGEKLLQQGITSLDQLSEKKKSKPFKKTLAETKVAISAPIRPKRLTYFPVPVYHYVPFYRHSVSHHINENHRHYFY